MVPVALRSANHSYVADLETLLPSNPYKRSNRKHSSLFHAPDRLPPQIWSCGMTSQSLPPHLPVLDPCDSPIADSSPPGPTPTKQKTRSRTHNAATRVAPDPAVPAGTTTTAMTIMLRGSPVIRVRHLRIRTATTTAGDRRSINSRLPCWRRTEEVMHRLRLRLRLMRLLNL